MDTAGNYTRYSRSSTYHLYSCAHHTDYQSIRTHLWRLMQDLGREPQPEEIAKAMEIDVSKVREIMKVSQEPTSLETPLGDEEDRPWATYFQILDLRRMNKHRARFKEHMEEVFKTTFWPRKRVLILVIWIRGWQTENVQRSYCTVCGDPRAYTSDRSKGIEKLRHPSRSKETQRLPRVIG